MIFHDYTDTTLRYEISIHGLQGLGMHIKLKEKLGGKDIQTTNLAIVKYISEAEAFVSDYIRPLKRYFKIEQHQKYILIIPTYVYYNSGDKNAV